MLDLFLKALKQSEVRYLAGRVVGETGLRLAARMLQQVLQATAVSSLTLR